MLLDEHNRLLRPLFAQHGGEEIKSTGDGFLVEFASALDAARSAIEIQRALAAHNTVVPGGTSWSDLSTSAIASERAEGTTTSASDW